MSPHMKSKPNCGFSVGGTMVQKRKKNLDGLGLGLTFGKMPDSIKFPLKPNYFKKQCFSSSFLLIRIKYTGPKWLWSTGQASCTHFRHRISLLTTPPNSMAILDLIFTSGK